MELNGGWRVATADEDLRRAYPDPNFDDARWATLDIPCHWRASADFDTSDGPLLHRRRFEASPATDGRRSWLTFDGIFYQSDVWLDGNYVGDTEGYFFPHTFEVTDALLARPDHVLAVEIACNPPTDRTAKHNLTGVFQHWDCADPAANPGGLWRPVRLSETGPVRISHLRVLCPEATPDRAVIAVRAVLDSARAGPATLRTTITAAATGVVAVETTTVQTLAAGENRISLTVPVDEPQLWWPHALGGQPLYDVAVAVEVSSAGASDRATRRTGLRQIRMKHWIMTVNGERLFLKGSNLGPTRMALGEATPDDLENDMRLAKQTGLDLVRIHAHISRPELYDAADRHGLLLWQDLPLQWGYARSVRKQAVRQSREAVDVLGHHPSVALWCGHNEPLAVDLDTESLSKASAGAVAKFLAMQELPTWNKTILDGSIKRTLTKSDPTRPVVAHSGILPHVGSGGTDSHFYFGWYHGEERDFPSLCAAFPRLARFVTEFGAQAVPDNADFMDPERWPGLDWERLGRHHSLQKAMFDRFVPPADYETFDAWRRATQEYQATVVRYHVETLRRLKYRPTGGFCQFSLADGYPAVTWAVFDIARAPKLAQAALAAACAPVVVVATRPAASYRPDEEVRLDVHVVSDLRSAIDGGRATATLGWQGGSRTWQWEGDVPPDSCVKVGTVSLAAPLTPGPLTLQLALAGPGLSAANRYESTISG